MSESRVALCLCVAGDLTHRSRSCSSGSVTARAARGTSRLFVPMAMRLNSQWQGSGADLASPRSLMDLGSGTHGRSGGDRKRGWAVENRQSRPDLRGYWTTGSPCRPTNVYHGNSPLRTLTPRGSAKYGEPDTLGINPPEA